MIWNTFILALRGIRRNVMRSVLTILGIIIGVAAVITLVTIGNGTYGPGDPADRRHGHQCTAH